MTFDVGQRVVCVDDSPGELCGTHTLSCGGVYMVTEVTCGGAGIHVDGAPTPNPSGWWHWRFRPVQERKTDISVFTALLTPSREREVV